MYGTLVYKYEYFTFIIFSAKAVGRTKTSIVGNVDDANHTNVEYPKAETVGYTPNRTELAVSADCLLDML